MSLGFVFEKPTALLTARRIWISAILMAALQTLIIGYVVVERAMILETGTEVVLKTAPVDPRDLLRGDYVTLNYDISRVPAKTLVGPIPADGGEKTLFVRLASQPDGMWTIAESSFASLPEKDGTVVIRSLPFNYYPVEPDQAFSVQYGIERYYVPEGEGHTVEQERTNGRITVAVRVGGTGVAQIRTLMLDGKAIYSEPLY